MVADYTGAFADYERNLLDGYDLKKSLGFLYESQCWSIESSYIHEGDDRRYMFIVTLKGIGEFAHSVAGRRLEKPYLSE